MKFNKKSIILICLVLLCSISVVCAHDNFQSSNTTIKYSNFSNIHSVNNNMSYEFSSNFSDILNVTDKVVNYDGCTLLVSVFDDHGTKWDHPINNAHVSIYDSDDGKLLDEGKTNKKGEILFNSSYLSYHYCIIMVKFSDGSIMEYERDPYLGISDIGFNHDNIVWIYIERFQC